MNKLLLSFLLLFSYPLMAQRLVKDIYPGHGDQHSYNQNYVRFGDKLFFAASTLQNGYEPWITDGTTAGTFMLKDINPGFVNSLYPWSNIQAAEMGGLLYFVANDGITGDQIWRTDGTSAGTIQVTNIPNQLQLQQQQIRFQIVAGASNIFFFMRSGSGWDLWKTDGTTQGTSLLSTQIYAQTGPSDLTVAGDYVYFSTFDRATGVTLYRVNIINKEKELITSNLISTFHYSPVFNMLPSFEEIGYVVAYKNEFYFLKYASETVSLCKVTQTGRVETILTLLNGGISFGDLHVKDELLFILLNGSNNERGYLQSLWVSDGTPQGTIKKFENYTASLITESKLTLYENKLYFLGPYIDGRYSLLEYNIGDNVLNQISPIQLTSDLVFANIAVSSKAFAVHYMTAGQPWWFGTKSRGLEKVNFGAVQASTASINDKILFTHLTSGHRGKLMAAEDNLNEAVVLKAIEQNGSAFGAINSYSIRSDLNNLYLFNGNVFFAANDKAGGMELWRSDGTASGTQSLDLVPGSASSVLSSNFTVYKNRLYFLSNNLRLWSSDGSREGTAEVLSNTSFMNIDGIGFPRLENTLLLFEHAMNGFKIWKTDGTSTGSYRFFDLANILPDVYSSYAHNLVETIDRVYFGVSASRRTFDAPYPPYYILETNGTEAGTKIAAGPFDYLPAMMSVGNTLFYAQKKLTGEMELWKKDINASPVKVQLPFTTYYIASLIEYKNKLYFEAHSDQYGIELWSTDGTAGGTKLVKDINEGNKSGLSRTPYVVHNDKLIFVANDETHGAELWETDGSEAGTRMIADINKGAGHSHANNFCSVNNELYFAAFTETHGMELWATNGTSSGTRRLSDIAPGPANANPMSPVYLDNKLFFAANDGIHGIELWVYETNITASPRPFEARYTIASPSPFDKTLTITLPTDIGASDVEVNLIDISGKIAYKASFISAPEKQITIATGNLSTGLYLLKVLNKEGVYQQKVIKL